MFAILSEVRLCLGFELVNAMFVHSCLLLSRAVRVTPWPNYQVQNHSHVLFVLHQLELELVSFFNNSDGTSIS
jgi:hypothetical protein